jgi:hypothetical protein
MGKREKARLAKLEAERAAKAAAKGGSAGAGSAGGGAGGASDEAGFQRLTELADMLVSAGELDVYGATCEQLRRWAALTLPRSEVEGEAGAKEDGGGKPGEGWRGYAPLLQAERGIWMHTPQKDYVRRATAEPA